MTDAASAAAFLLMYAVYPLWVLAGLADWFCHRATSIATTGGLKENAMHWLMFGEIGVAMLAYVFLEPNGALLAIVFGVFIVHEVTVYCELDFTTLVRDVGPFEQMVHSFLELLPIVSLGLIAVIAWPNVWDLSLRPRASAMPTDYLIAAAAATALLNALPLLQETISCLASRRQAGRPLQDRVEPQL